MFGGCSSNINEAAKTFEILTKNCNGKVSMTVSISDWGNKVEMTCDNYIEIK